MPVSEPVTIELRGDPVPWARTRIGKSGVLFNPAKQRNNAAALKIAAMQAMGGRVPFDGPVILHITASFPIPKSWSKRKIAEAQLRLRLVTRRPDLSNIIKQIEDALNGVVFRDDALVASILARKIYDAIPSVLITVRPL